MEKTFKPKAIHDDPASRSPEAYDWFGLAEQLCEINNGFYDEDVPLEPQDLIDFLKDWPVSELETHMYDPTGKVILLGRLIQYRDEKIAYELKKELGEI